MGPGLRGDGEGRRVPGSWGLETLGKYYPDLVTDWLAQDVMIQQRKHRALMLGKAMTWLADEQKARIIETA